MIVLLPLYALCILGIIVHLMEQSEGAKRSASRRNKR